MKLEIVTKNVKDESVLRQYVQKKVQHALARFEDRVGSVTVRLEDETRDSAAFDGLCSIEVEMVPRGHVHVSCHGESGFDCVMQATQKMENAVKHDIERHRQSSRARHQQSKREFLGTLEQGAEG